MSLIEFKEREDIKTENNSKEEVEVISINKIIRMFPLTRITTISTVINKREFISIRIIKMITTKTKIVIKTDPTTTNKVKITTNKVATITNKVEIVTNKVEITTTKEEIKVTEESNSRTINQISINKLDLIIIEVIPEKKVTTTATTITIITKIKLLKTE